MLRYGDRKGQLQPSSHHEHQQQLAPQAHQQLHAQLQPRAQSRRSDLRGQRESGRMVVPAPTSTTLTLYRSVRVSPLLAC